MHGELTGETLGGPYQAETEGYRSPLCETSKAAAHAAQTNLQERFGAIGARSFDVYVVHVPTGRRRKLPRR